MLRLPPFDYLAPRSIEEAVQLFSAHAPEVMYVAGGTDLFPNMKRRQMEPKYLIGLSGLGELRGIGFGREDGPRTRPAAPGGGRVPGHAPRTNGDGVAIGAGTTLTQLSNHPAIRQYYPALAAAAGLVSTPQLRTMGTLGGNLCLDTRCNYYNQTFWWRKSINFCMKKDGEICWVAPGSRRCWAVSSTDCAPVVIALGGRVRLVGPRGERVIPARELYRDDGMDYLAKAQDEIVAEILLPPADGLRSVYLKLRRRGSFDFPILGVAAALQFAANGQVEQARIVLGGVGSHPLECVESALMLTGQKLTPELIEAAAEAAWKPARPLDNTDLSHSYRKKMSRVYVKRALEIFKDGSS
jgi:4-hydroxybenzoyl-CoA reductase subunit beta